MTIRSYQHDKDFEGAVRIYREVGWVTEKAHETAVEHLLKSGRGLVVELHGSAEGLAIADTGTIRHLDTDLSLSIVTSVLTSRIARKQGFASRLTAQLLAYEAERGHALQVPVKARVPQRLGVDDWQAMHAGRLKRLHLHGACSITAPALTHADTLWTEHGFGMGYLDEQGDLSHHLWCSAKGESGPYRVNWMAYRTRDEFLELMALLHSLGEQVLSIKMNEPPGIQLQDFIRQPFKMRQLTQRSPHENTMRATAYWQVRVLDLDQCLAAVKLSCEPVRFNVVLSDPITSLLPQTSSWKGIAGDYTITLGPDSTADDLEAPESLLTALDEALRMPLPMPDWEF